MHRGGAVAREAHRLCEAAVQALERDLVLLDCEFVQEEGEQVLRLIIDSENGIDFQDCEAVTEAVNPILDEDLSYKGTYLLEVSSLGLEEPLPDFETFLRHRGERMDFDLKEAIEGQQHFTADVLQVEGSLLTVQVHFDQRQLKGRRLSEKKRRELEPQLSFDWEVVQRVKRHLEF